MTTLTLAVALALPACGLVTSGDDSGGGSDADAGKPTTTQPTTPYERWSEPKTKPDLSKTFGISMPTGEGPFAAFIDAATAVADDGGLKTSVALSKSNASTSASQMDSFLQRGTSSLFVQDFDPASQKPLIKQIMDKGSAVTSLNMPATTQITASQYNIGRQLAEGTLDYIAKNLDNKANLVHYNIEFVLPERERGWNDVMKDRPEGVKIVANVSGNPMTQETGNKTMTSLLQKNPDINVVDGGDTLLLGALAAFETAGKADNPDLALIGSDGDPQAIAAIEKGGPFKATFALNVPILGALAGKFATDWAEGYNVPQLVLVPTVQLSDAESIKVYNDAVSDPVAALKTAEGTYYESFGSISYETRNNYFDGMVK